MTVEKPGIAIIGAGIGGLATAASLIRLDFKVEVYEQAGAFAPIGAGIQLTANAMKALRGLGLVEPLRSQGFVPAAFHSREWDTANLTNVLIMGKPLEQRYGVPDLMIHRARLHSALAALTPRDCIHFCKKLLAIEQNESGATLAFADGSRVESPLVVGADGIHSAVREALFGVEQPRFTGRVAYRATYPAARILDGVTIDERAKWWGPDRHVVHYFTTASRDEIYFIAVTPEPEFHVESWSMRGDKDMLLAAFAGFHPRVRAVLAAAPEVRKWALVERDPMPSWGRNRIVLLGDACHPMMPYMAQGAASAIEDAVVLARCLADADDDIPTALAVYADSRKERTARMQLTSRQNSWLRQKTDTDWVYEYDAWHAQLAWSGMEFG